MDVSAVLRKGAHDHGKRTSILHIIYNIPPSLRAHADGARWGCGLGAGAPLSWRSDQSSWSLLTINRVCASFLPPPTTNYMLYATASPPRQRKRLGLQYQYPGHAAAAHLQGRGSFAHHTPPSHISHLQWTMGPGGVPGSKPPQKEPNERGGGVFVCCGVYGVNEAPFGHPPPIG
jgi:hypothetical protein